LAAALFASLAHAQQNILMPEHLGVRVLAGSTIPSECPPVAEGAIEPGPNCVTFAPERAADMRAGYRRAVEREGWVLARETAESMVFERALEHTTCSMRLTLMSATFGERAGLVFDLPRALFCDDERLLG
jgi:hypothetical protein